MHGARALRALSASLWEETRSAIFTHLLFLIPNRNFALHRHKLPLNEETPDHVHSIWIRARGHAVGHSDLRDEQVGISEFFNTSAFVIREEEVVTPGSRNPSFRCAPGHQPW